MPGVSEARSRHPRLGSVEEQDGSAFAGERIGDGRADCASTHHCHGVIAYHLEIVIPVQAEAIGFEPST